MFMVTAVFFVFSLLALLLPHRRNEGLDEATLQRNYNRYKLYNSLAVIPLFIFLALFIWMFYSLGHGVNDWKKSFDGPALQVCAEGMVWMLPASMLGFGFVAIPMTLLYRLLLGNQYPLYLEAISRLYGWDGMKVMKPVFVVMILIGIISFALLLDLRMRIAGDKLIINNLFELKDNEYRIADINEVAHFDGYSTRDGNTIEKNMYVLFANGAEIFNSRGSLFDVESPEFHSILEHIASVNKLKISERETYE